MEQTILAYSGLKCMVVRTSLIVTLEEDLGRLLEQTKTTFNGGTKRAKCVYFCMKRMIDTFREAATAAGTTCRCISGTSALCDSDLVGRTDFFGDELRNLSFSSDLANAIVALAKINDVCTGPLDFVRGVNLKLISFLHFRKILKI